MMDDGESADRERAYRSLLKDMRLALLSEIGAHAMYDRLARRTNDEALTSLLWRLHEDGGRAIDELVDLMRGMGARPRKTSKRRRLLAHMLALASRAVGVRPVLRVCWNAEETVSRWYAEYALFLWRLNDEERARRCELLSTVKRTHAQALGAWVTNLPRRSSR